MDHLRVVRSEARDRCLMPGAGSWGLIILFVVACAISAGADDATLAWAKRAGGGTTDEGAAIAVDDQGNTYVTGYFRLTATFGAGDPSPVQLTALGQDVFVAKYGPGGALRWVRQARSQAGWGSGVGVDAAGTVTCLGTLGLPSPLRPEHPNRSRSTRWPMICFWPSMTKTGNFLWAKQTHGSNSENANGIAVDPRRQQFRNRTVWLEPTDARSG
jgi:hypothetical protein